MRRAGRAPRHVAALRRRRAWADARGSRRARPPRPGGTRSSPGQRHTRCERPPRCSRVSTPSATARRPSACAIPTTEANRRRWRAPVGEPRDEGAVDLEHVDRAVADPAPEQAGVEAALEQVVLRPSCTAWTASPSSPGPPRTTSGRSGAACCSRATDSSPGAWDSDRSSSTQATSPATRPPRASPSVARLRTPTSSTSVARSISPIESASSRLLSITSTHGGCSRLEQAGAGRPGASRDHAAPPLGAAERRRASTRRVGRMSLTSAAERKT